MGEAGGARGIWGYVEGGMGGLANALEAACADLRVDIVREAEVAQILTDETKVRGVALADSTVLEAPIVASSVDAHLTFERMLDPQIDLPLEEVIAEVFAQGKDVPRNHDAMTEKVPSQ